MNKNKKVFAFNRDYSFKVLTIILLINLFTCFNQLNGQSFSDSSKNTISSQDVPSDFNEKVTFKASDSIVFYKKQNIGRLYGKAHMETEGRIIDAEIIESDINESTFTAMGTQDSTGKWKGTPVFIDGGETIEANKIIFNTTTGKGIIMDVRTQEGDGYIHGDTIKKHSNNHIHVKGAVYTTCDLEHPHFGFKMTKMIIVPDDKVVSGPGYMMINEIPTPLVVPFALFPNSKRNKAGVIIPSYGQSDAQGFFLQDLGWYQPIGEVMSLKFLGDIYTRGSWKIQNLTRYKFRYKYNGSFNISYAQTKFGSKRFNDFTQNNNFFLRWNHNQDHKFNPYSTFVANVNVGSTQNFRQDLNASANDYLNNTFNSNIRFGYRFPNSPFSINVAARHSQNSQTGIMQFILPEIAVNMSRISPLAFMRSREAVGPQKWFEKINLVYSANLKNQWNTYDSVFKKQDYLLESLDENLRYGIKQNATLSGNFKFFKKKFNFNPSFRAEDVIFFRKEYINGIDPLNNGDFTARDTTDQRLVTHELAWDASANISTKIVGIWTLGKGKGFIQKFRHSITPTVGVTYQPDFDSRYTYLSTDTINNITEEIYYNPYYREIFQPRAAGERGSANFGIQSALEMKIKDKKDTISGSKKIKLIENYNIRTNYNFLADSLQWADISMSANTKLFNFFDIRYTGVFTAYQRDSSGRKYESFLVDDYNFGDPLLDLLNTNVNVSFTLSNKDFIQKREGEKKLSPYAIPFTAQFGYNLNLRRNRVQGRDTNIVTQAITLNANVNLTPQWRITVRTGYDFVNNALTYTSVDFFRQLHCWEIGFNWIPVGFRKSYRFTIRVSATALRDLKFERRKPWYDN